MSERMTGLMHTETVHDKTPETLSDSAFTELRDSLEALFSDEGSEAGWVALSQLVEDEKQDEVVVRPARLGLQQAFEMVMQFKRYFPDEYRRHFSRLEGYSRAILEALQPETRISIFDGSGYEGGVVLKGIPTPIVSARSPFELSLVFTDTTGEVHTRNVLPASITVHELALAS